MLLAVHDEAPHRLAIWVVGSSLTDCGWRRESGVRGEEEWGGGVREEEEGGREERSISAFNQGSVAEAKIICWSSLRPGWSLMRLKALIRDWTRPLGKH